MDARDGGWEYLARFDWESRALFPFFAAHIECDYVMDVTISLLPYFSQDPTFHHHQKGNCDVERHLHRTFQPSEHFLERWRFWKTK